MDLEKRVTEHGARIDAVEKEVIGLKKDLSEGLTRVDSSNQYLREQNNNILNEIIRRNKGADQHEFEITKMTKANQQKMFGTIFGAGGLIAVVIDMLIRFAN